VFIINIIVGLMGYGYYTYQYAKIGIKGFFYAGNEVAVLFYCLYYYFLTITGVKKIILVYGMAFAVSLLIATKTGFLAFLLISCVDFYMRSSKKGKFYIKLLLPAILIILAMAGIRFFPQTKFYQYVEYHINASLSRGETIFSALLSGRLSFLKNNFHVWKTTLTPRTFFLGMGMAIPKTIEIDFFDTLFYFGFLFLLLTMSYYLYLVALSIRKKKYELTFFNLIYLLISFTAGHVWHSVMAGMFFAYINAYEFNKISHKSVKRVSA
jgi:hypothetical protein